MTPPPGTVFRQRIEAEGRIAMDRFPEDRVFVTLALPVGRYRQPGRGQVTDEMIDCDRRFWRCRSDRGESLLRIRYAFPRREDGRSRMRNNDGTDSTDVGVAGSLYAAAYAAHYGAKDLQAAFELYRSLVSSHPDTPEAGYARSQIRHIAKATVPQEKLFDAEVDLTLACFGRGERADER